MLDGFITDVITAHKETNISVKRQCQPVFVSVKSCLTYLSEFFQEVTCSVDKGELIDVLKFEKLLDKMPYQS